MAKKQLVFYLTKEILRNEKDAVQQIVLTSNFCQQRYVVAWGINTEDKRPFTEQLVYQSIKRSVSILLSNREDSQAKDTVVSENKTQKSLSQISYKFEFNNEWHITGELKKRKEKSEYKFSRQAFAVPFEKEEILALGNMVLLL